MRDLQLQQKVLVGRNPPSIWPKLLKHKEAYLFILPIIIFLGVFKYYTFFSAIVESFFTWNGANVNKFVGFKNYITLFSDTIFFGSLVNSAILIISGAIITLTFPLVAALLVFNCKNIRMANFYKVGFIIPMVVPGVVVYMMWKWIYSYDTGAINQFLKGVGLEELMKAWLGSSDTAMWAIILIGFPFVGFPWLYGLEFLVYLGGLMNISADIFESAEIDGIKWNQKLAFIQLPLLRSQMKVLLMLSVMSSVQAFENILVLTSGGPGRSTMVPALYMFQQAFTYNNFGYASTIGVTLFMIVLFLTIINYKFIKPADKMN